MESPAKRWSWAIPAASASSAAQPVKQLVQGRDQVGIIAQCIGLIEQFQPNPPATPLLAISIPGVIDEYPPHRFSSRRKEVPPTVELLIAK